MAILTVYEYPDTRLRQPGETVVDFGPQFQQRVDDLVETLYSHSGAVGLAATQVGLPLRVFLLDLYPQQPASHLTIFVNPSIADCSRWKVAREGCLSFPQYLANVKRARRLTVTGCDRVGTPFVRSVEGFEAIAIQHELDHLDGILFVDRIRSISRDLRLRNNGESEKPD